MTSTTGCKPFNGIYPYLTWKTASKRCRSSRRKKLFSENFTAVKYNHALKETEPISQSDTEKNSVDILGSRFEDNLGHVPIKKRRFQAFSTYLHQSTSSIPKRQRKASRSKMKSLVCEDDFSGIEILAAVACHDDFARQWLSQQDSAPSLIAKDEPLDYVEDKKIPNWDLNEPPSEELCASAAEIAPSEDRKEIETKEIDAKDTSVINQTAPEPSDVEDEESDKNTVSHSHLTTNLEDSKFTKGPSPVHDGSEELLQKSSVDSSTTHSEANLAKTIAEDGENSESNIFEADKIREMFCDSSQFEDGELRDYDERRFVEDRRHHNSRIDLIGGKSRVYSKESLPKPCGRDETMSRKLSSQMGFWNAKRPIRYDGPPRLKFESERHPQKPLDNLSQRRTFPRNEYHNHKPLLEDFDRHRFETRRNFYFPRSRSPPFHEFRHRMAFPKRVPEYSDDVSPPRGRYHEERKYVHRFPRVTSEGQLRNSYEGRYKYDSEREYDYKRVGSERVGWRFDSDREAYRPSGKKVRDVGSGSRGEDGRRCVKRYGDDFGVRSFMSHSHERKTGPARYHLRE